MDPRPCSSPSSHSQEDTRIPRGSRVDNRLRPRTASLCHYPYPNNKYRSRTNLGYPMLHSLGTGDTTHALSATRARRRRVAMQKNLATARHLRSTLMHPSPSAPSAYAQVSIQYLLAPSGATRDPNNNACSTPSGGLQPLVIVCLSSGASP